MADDNAFDMDAAYAAMRPHQRGLFNTIGALAVGGKKLIDGAIDAVTLPGRVVRGEAQPDDVGENTNFATSLMGGGTLAGRPANSVGIFAGRTAKTADLEALRRAKSADKQGVPREDIWTNEGWFKGTDGKWRFEIDDSGARTKKEMRQAAEVADNLRGGGEAGDSYRRTIGIRDDLLRKVRNGELTKEAAEAEWKIAQEAHFKVQGDANKLWARVESMNSEGPYLSNAFDHPELIAAYPKLAKMPTNIAAENLPYHINGYFDIDPARVKTPERGRMVVNSSAPERRSVVLHELQHAVQGKEGFASGGSPDMMMNSPSAYRFYKERLASIQDWYRRAQEQLKQARTPDNEADFLKASEALAKVGNNPGWQDLLKSYRHLTGEAEARQVQARANLSADERRMRPPWLDLDIPESDLINLFEKSK